MTFIGKNYSSRMVAAIRAPTLIIIALLIQQSICAGQQLDVKEFVRQTFMHGVPYEQAKGYGAADVAILLQMLESPAEEGNWSNIVVTLGMIGNERAVDPIIGFIMRNESGVLSAARYLAKTSAIMSLGYLANNNRGGKALVFLQTYARPGAWEERKLSWVSPFQSGVRERNIRLSAAAILGLALSGQPAAAGTLRQLRASGEARLTGTDNTVQEALKEYEKVSRQGLEGYYRNNEIR